MKHKSLLFIIVITICSCNKNIENSFSLTGNITGIENGTVLYLMDPNTEKLIDSTIVENDKFYFDTKIEESPTIVFLRARDNSIFRSLWIENNPITLKGSRENIWEAEIEGSELQLKQEEYQKAISGLSGKEYGDALIEFIKSNPNSIISAYNLHNLMKIFSRTDEAYDYLSPEMKNSKYGKTISEFLELFKSPDIGKKFAELELNNVNGEEVRLSNSLGKATFIEFWASWCGNCRGENPNLLKTYNEYHHKGFEIYAISLDTDKERWQKAIKEDSLNWIHVSDLKGMDKSMASLIYGIYEIPFNYLLDENGTIVGKDLYGDDLNTKLHELLE